MDTKAPKKCRPCKKSRTGTQENFARKFPYRFSWLAEPKLESLQAWEVAKMKSSLREQLPLQKMLVPTRSIPDTQTNACPKPGCHLPGTQQLSVTEGPPGLTGSEPPPTSQGPQPHKQGCPGMLGLGNICSPWGCPWLHTPCITLAGHRDAHGPLNGTPRVSAHTCMCARAHTHTHTHGSTGGALLCPLH
uniref:Uncharacterized protein n=1 Tax=Catagonus wagneri TaxID=51154 RepID=A0A8C3W545_9CETA